MLSWLFSLCDVGQNDRSAVKLIKFKLWWLLFYAGVNGAGKTTTFRMLTGDETPSGGDAFINGASILKDTDRARLDIGYCPQFDALFSKLTADEHLKFYARLKGLDEPSTQEVKSDKTNISLCI